MSTVRADVVAVLAAWIGLSATLILFNAHLLSSFRHPVALTACHQAVSVVLVLCIRLVRPSLLATGDADAGVPPLTFSKAVALGLPVALCQSVGLVCGNAAVMYLSVAFCQMVKAWTPACVYAGGCLVGTQEWSAPVVKCIGAITVGLMITGAGELKFHWGGFALQVAALLAEGLRLNLLELRLKSKGYKLHPLVSVQVFAPMVGSTLLLCALAFDRGAFDLVLIDSIGREVFLANGLVAFFLNVVIYLAIQRTSGLIYAMTGIIKDIMIIAGSLVFQGSTITLAQVAGYLIAVAGLQAYGIVSREPALFGAGVAKGLVRHLFGGLAVQPHKTDLPFITVGLGIEKGGGPAANTGDRPMVAFAQEDDARNCRHRESA